MSATPTFLDSATQPVSKTLLIGVAGTTGSGKTESAMRIATGIAGDKFAVIDTENRRALNKKSRYRFSHYDMQAPYTPEAFKEAITAAVNGGFKAIIVDSFSAEWDDEGGLTDIATANIERMSRGDAQRAEAITGLAWKEPKVRHRALMRYLRKLEIPIIFCLRAEPKIKYIKEYDEKRGREVTKVVDAGWLPITEKLFGYDMLIYALMMPENPGIPVHLKKLEPEFEPMFPIGKQITEESGRRLAAWAHEQRPAQASEAARPGAESPVPSPSRGAPLLTPDQHIAITDRLRELGISHARACKAWDVESVSALPQSLYERAMNWIDRAAEKAAS